MSEFGDREEKNLMQQAKNKSKDMAKKMTRKVLLSMIKAIIIAVGKYLLIAILVATIVSAIVGFIEGLFDWDSASASNLAGTYDGTLIGDTVEEQTWNFLIANGATKVGAAALMGNIYRESHFDPTLSEDYGYAHPHGLIQWTTESGRFGKLEAYANERGTTWDDLQTQLEFMWKEITEGYEKTRNVILTANDEEKLYACDTKGKCTCCYPIIIRDDYEKPGYGHSYDAQCVRERKEWAKKYYEMFKDIEPPSTGEILDSQGGEWKKFTIDNKIIGTFKSSITEKTFYIYNQGAKKDTGASNSWGVWCNRAAAICLCSGYYAKNTDDAVELFWKANNAGYDINCQSFYNSYGLIRTSIGNGYSNNKAKLRTALKSGKYGLIYIRNSNYYGASGQKWASTAHWLPIIGYQVVNGSEQIFVSDPGHGGTGWYSINEFNSATKVDCYIVSEK